MNWFTKYKDYYLINIYLSPNKHINQIVDINEKFLKINIKSPPTNGKANQELINFLSNILGINKSNITIKIGLINRKKTIRINCYDDENIFVQKFGVLF